MKLKSIGGKWYIKDGERLIILEKGAYAFAYALIMAKIRKKDKTVIKNNYTVICTICLKTPGSTRMTFLKKPGSKS